MSCRLSSLGVVLTPLLFATVVSSTAEAQSSEEIARERFAAGQQLMDEGDYLEAYAEFAAGYGLTSRPLFLYNMGQAARLGRQREDAIRDYQRYLEAVPDGRVADEARSWLRLLGAEQGTEPVGSETETETETETTPPTPEETAAAAMAAEDDEPAAPPPSETGDEGSRLGLWIGVAAGVLALVAAGVVLGVMLSDDSEPLPQGNFGMTVTALGAGR